MVAMKREDIINSPEPETVRGLRMPRGKILFSLSASCFKKKNNRTIPAKHKTLATPVLLTTPA